MNDQPNPYAPPTFESDVGPVLGYSGTGLRREGDLVMIAAEGTIFPPRCVVCNAPATKRLKRRLFWHPPGYYALACLGLLIYAVVAMIVRKSATFEVGLCPDHAKRRLYGILLGWIGTPLLFVAGPALVEVSHELSLLLLPLGLVTVVAGLLMAQVVKAARIENGYAWIKVGRAFLDSL